MPNGYLKFMDVCEVMAKNIAKNVTTIAVP
jgi:hypothetical protein